MKNTTFKSMGLLLLIAVAGSALYQTTAHADHYGYYDDQGVYHEREHRGLIRGVLSVPGRTVDAVTGEPYEECEHLIGSGRRERCREREARERQEQQQYQQPMPQQQYQQPMPQQQRPMTYQE